MSGYTPDLPLPFWANNLEALDREIARLSMLCDIRILEPGAMERVLRNDPLVCGTNNPVAFDKLRPLLMLHFSIHQKAVDSFGPAQMAQVEDLIINRLKPHFPQVLGE
jgi:hypothetical protein